MKELGSAINSDRARVPIVLLAGLIVVAASVVVTVALTNGGGSPAGADSLAAPAQRIDPENAPAYNVFAQISTDLHGALHTNSQFGDRQDWIEILEFNHSVTSPRDAASGLSTGRRQHQPIVITKLIDGASPQLFEALARNETVTLTLEFERPGDGGVPQTYYKIVATGGAVSGIRQNAGTVNFDTETISITYQTITVENLLDNTQAQDDWLQQF